MQEAIGIIGGSGLYEMEGLEDVREVSVPTPFGMPSDNLICGNYGAKKLVFLPRHGKGHRYMPSEVPYRANIYALKSMGVTQVLSLSAVGSLSEEAKPGDIVVPDQFIDRTVSRPNTFFGNGIVGHVGMADPVCPRLTEAILKVGEGMEPTFHSGGAYVGIEGPTFGTRAESHLYRSWGARVVGMTNATEAKLAREAELCYVTVAMVTDYDCWHEEDVTIETILAVLAQNVENSREIIRRAVTLLSEQGGCACRSAAQYAVMTPAELIPAETRRKVELLYGKYLKG
ncbi:MAG: S-methyl-5'-thioadenosine phosphorylase [Deltaproteobacteria bacterium]|nr:MAG: S-methyl-5'-thioadenosine phosphorylase [Deltaproteobacteria bacterium]